MKKIVSTIVVVCCLCIPAIAQKTSRQIVPIDKDLRYGTLDNGLKYYVRGGTTGKGIGEFRLVQRTGSLVETDEQLGLAHFLEHMQFKGTKHFPDNAILDFLRRNGVAFGPDVNAFTNYEHTQYLLSGVPVSKPEIIDSCLLILRDWSADATLDNAAFESERNVIVEEWRARSVLNSSQELLTAIYAGTMYEKRMPLGDMDIIRNCSIDQLKAYYSKWYQPQNQAVIVAGDFNPDEVVKKIKTLFGDLKKGTTIVPYYKPIPDFDAPRVVTARNNMLPIAYMEVIVKHDLPSTDQMRYMKYVKNEEIDRVAVDILKRRLAKIDKGNLKLLSASSRIQPYLNCSNANMAYMNITTQSDSWRDALKLSLIEIEKMKRFTVSEGELCANRPIAAESEKKTSEDKTIINFNNATLELPDGLKAKDAADKCTNMFLRGERSLLSNMTRGVLNKYYATHITKEMVQQSIRRLFTRKNLAVTLTFPNDSTPLPATEDVLALLDEVEQMELADPNKESKSEVKEEKPKVVEEKTDLLVRPAELDEDVTPGEILKTTKLTDIAATEYLLSNGIRVIVSDTLANDNYTRVNGFLKGGASLLENDEMAYKSLFTGCLNTYYTKYTKVINTYFVNDNSINASCGYLPHQTEDAFKGFHAFLTHVDIDTIKFDKYKEELTRPNALLQGQALNIFKKMMGLHLKSDERDLWKFNNSSDNMSIEGMRRAGERLQSNYNGMLFFIKKGKDAVDVVPFIKKYIASLPSLSEPAECIDRPDFHIKDQDYTCEEIIENPTPIAEVYLVLGQEDNYKFGPTQKIYIDALASVLSQALINNIRIKNSDVYNIKSGGASVPIPVAYQTCTIAFNCNPQNAKTILEDIESLLNQMVEGDVITQQLIDGYINGKAKDFKPDNGSEPKVNSFEKIRDEYLTGEYINESYSQYKQTIKSITPSDLKQYLADILKYGHRYKLIFRTKE